MLRFIPILFTGILLISCANDDSPEFDTLDEQIDYLIESDQYERAISVLESEDQNDSDIFHLKEKTHLNYALYNMSTFDEDEMRTRMNEALRQFVYVLRINPDNQVAQNQIEQILSIYATIPDRNPEEDVIEMLAGIGYEIQ